MANLVRGPTTQSFRSIASLMPTAPLAAATSTAQLDQLFAAASLKLSADDMATLGRASATFR